MIRSLAVAIHDVEPRSFQRTQEIRTWLTERGVERVTLLVIPASELHPIGARAPGLIAWLRECSASGDTLAQHGLAHRATYRAPWPRSVLAGFQGGRAAEFPGLDPEATRLRVAMGLRLLRDAELDPSGFVAPGYAYTRALRQALADASYAWSADLGGVNTQAGGRIRARALCLGSSTPLKRALSPTVVLAAARGDGELMRLDVHPADFDLPGHVCGDRGRARARPRAARHHLRRSRWLTRRRMRSATPGCAPVPSGCSPPTGARVTAPVMASPTPSPARPRPGTATSGTGTPAFTRSPGATSILARARQELTTLVRAGRLDGFIPHTAFWDRPAYWRRAPFYGTHTVFGASATATIQTPLLALAWELVAAASPDHPEFVTDGLPQLRLHYDWLARERDVDGDGLLTTIYPDESGLDDSPKYDEVFGRMRHDRIGYWWLIERYRRMGYDAHAITARYDEHVEDVLVNVFYALSLRALSRLDDESGEKWLARALQTETALLERCYDERTGLFCDLAGRTERRVTVSTWSSLAPLALTGLPTDVRRRLVEEQLLHPGRYLANCGIPSVAISEPTFNPGFALWRCWRGPAWMNTAWLLVPAMRQLGYGTSRGSDHPLARAGRRSRRVPRVLQPAHRPWSGRPRFRLCHPPDRSSRT